MVRRTGLLMGLALLLLTATAALAGGWAVITLDNPPGEIHAGEPWRLGITVLQHGETPVHRLDPRSPIEPLLVAEHPSGRRVEVMATPTEELGHFVFEVNFPVEGDWAWTIYPNPLAGETVLEPLTVLPAVSAVDNAAVEKAAAPVSGPVAGDIALRDGLRWAGLAAALATVVILVAQGRRRPARVES